MLSRSVKYAAPLLLVFALCFLAGQASAFVVADITTQVDKCCDHSDKTSQTSPEGECSDADCLCYSCVDLTLWVLPELSTASQPLASTSVNWAFAQPSGHIRTIDYPPELS